MRARLVEAGARAQLANDFGEDIIDRWAGTRLGDQYRARATIALDAILTILAEPDEAMVEAAASDPLRLSGPEVQRVWGAMLATIAKP